MTTVHGNPAGRRLVWLLSLVLTACAGSVGDPAGRGDDLVAPPTTVPIPGTTVADPETTVPEVQISEGMLTVETALGSWRWVREEEPGLGWPLLDDPIRVELPDPPLPEIEELVWPQIEQTSWEGIWEAPVGGSPVASAGATITPAAVLGVIDWNRFYTAPFPYEWVEGRWRPLEGDCPWVEVCDTETATLEITPVRWEQEGDGGSYPVGRPIDVLVATIVRGDPDAVEFRDEQTREMVLRVEANDDMTAQQLLRAGQFCVGGMDCGGPMYLWKLYVDGVGWVEPPWSGLEMAGWPGVTAGTRDDGFWIVGIEGLSRDSITLHVWGSTDGVMWDEVATPVSLGDPFPNGFQVELVDGELMILTPYQNPDEPPIPPKVLRLVDGELTEIDVDLSALGWAQGVDLSDFSSTPWGWTIVTWIPDSSWGVCQVWVSADGSNWESVAMPDGNDIGDTVRVFAHAISDDGAFLTAENPVPTSAEDVPADVTGSHCLIGDDGSVYLEFGHDVEEGGIVWEGERYRDYFNTSWTGGLVDGEDG